MNFKTFATHVSMRYNEFHIFLNAWSLSTTPHLSGPRCCKLAETQVTAGYAVLAEGPVGTLLWRGSLDPSQKGLKWKDCKYKESYTLAHSYFINTLANTY